MVSPPPQHQPPQRPPILTLLPVLGTPLSIHQKGEGAKKSGYCSSAPYSIAATLTHAFLQSDYGNDPPYKGHSAGMKMCISAQHFKQAIKEMGPDEGPKVDLKATSETALSVVRMEELRDFAVHKGGQRGGEL
jgi:uncharacterized protein (DUF2237 family)